MKVDQEVRAAFFSS